MSREPLLLRLRGWIQNWLLADPEQSTLLDALDQELSRREPWRLDTRDGVLQDDATVSRVYGAYPLKPDNDRLTPEERADFDAIADMWEKP